MNKNTLCVVPFLGGCIRPTGKLAVCCISKTSRKYSYKNIDEWLNSNELINLRKDLYNGIKNENCIKCWQKQDIGQISLRQLYNSSLFKKEVKNIILETAKNNFILEKNEIKFLDLKLGNLCNLQCIMCNPESSSRLFTEWKNNKHIFKDFERYENINFSYPENDDFKEILYPHLKDLIYVKFTGGEPLINPYIDDIINNLNENCIVHITTNLTKLDCFKLSRFSNFKNLWFTISVDAIDELHEIIRYPSKWKILEKNIDLVCKNLTNAHLNFSIVLNALSILQIDRTINFLDAYNKNIDISFMTNPIQLTLDCIPEIWLDKINKKILNIKNQKFRSEVKKMLDNRKYDDKKYIMFLDYIKNLSNLRNVKIDCNEFLISI